LSAGIFLTKTEPAVRHMFLALQAYRDLTPRPSLVQFKHEDGGVPLKRDQATDFLKAESDAMELDVAKATLSGAIFQVAYSSIKLYSTNKKDSSSCRQLDIPIKRKTKFCVGRVIHGLPLGLLVYAARVQYNHWEDGGALNPTARGVFDHLAEVRSNDVWNDLVYELDWPARRLVSHHILQLELEWDTYDKYISDMREVFSLSDGG